MNQYKGLVGYEGLAKRGYEGLGTLIRAAFLRPVHIVRQTISNLDTGNISLSAYHANKGLSSLPQKTRESRSIPNIPGVITNHISGVWGICGYNGLGFEEIKV